MPAVAYAAAIGAVMAEEMPAAKRPMLVMYLAQRPARGSNCCAISVPEVILVPVPAKAAAAVTMTAIDITPPRTIATERSNLASGRSEGLCHRS